MKRDLRGRRILITGASSGIGRSLAEQAASDGARLLLAARSHDKLQELAGILGGRGAEVHTVAADVTRDEDRQRLRDAAATQLGGLDALINNAGVGSWGHFAD